MNAIDLCKEIGIDTKAAIQRFSGKAANYEKYLLLFPSDESFGTIGTAIDKGDWALMRSAAHTLKGLAGNLGMTRIFKACSRMVECLKDSRPEEAMQVYPELAEAYREVCSALSKVEGKKE